MTKEWIARRLRMGTRLEGCPNPAKSMPKGSLADRVKHLAGIGRGEYADLSTNKAHMADFGK